MRNIEKYMKRIFIVSLIFTEIIMTGYMENSKVLASSLAGEYYHENAIGTSGSALTLGKTTVYCLEAGKDFNSLLSNKAAVDRVLKGDYGYKYNTEDKAKKAAEAKWNELFSGQFPHTGQGDTNDVFTLHVMNDNRATSQKDATIAALATLGMTEQDMANAYHGKGSLYNASVEAMRWVNTGAFATEPSITHDGGTLTYDGSGCYKSGNIVVSFPTCKLGSHQLSKITGISVSNGGTASTSTPKSGEPFTITVPYKGNESLKSITVTAFIRYYAGYKITVPAKYYKCEIYNRKLTMGKISTSPVYNTDKNGKTEKTYNYDISHRNPWCT